MNTTESLDGAGKSPDLSSVTRETVIPGDTSITENKRRRLVRGAVAFAPLVLTLRSGALAAASCTGVKLPDVTVQSDGEVPGTVGGDVCVQGLQTCPTSASKVVTTHKPSIYATVGLNSSGDKYTCGGTSPQFVGQQVAILSSGSASSMGIA